MTTTTINQPQENEVFKYMKEQYEENRRIPSIEELFKRFPKAGWIKINDALYEFDAWHTEWVGSFRGGEGA